MWYARAFALRTAPTILRAVPMAIFALFVLPAIGLDEWRLVPPTWSAGLGFLVTIGFTLALGCAISALVTISLLWTINGEGAATISVSLVWFLSGMLVPLPLFPECAQTVLQWLPFAGLLDQPFRIFTGDLP